jgi:hypothetical protein
MTAAAMAATPDPLQQRYEAIERVYSERRWDDVARRSEELLLELPNDPGHPLRQRLQLLLGHTYLYGYQDAATASGFYSRVQAASKEPVLLDIAALGLQQCASLESASPAAAAETPPERTEEPAIEPTAVAIGQAFPFTAEAVNPAAPGSSDARPAMPWMEHLGGSDPAATTAPSPATAPAPAPALVAEVIDEPELIEVAQADRAQAEELEVTVSKELPDSIQELSSEPINRLSPEEIAELSKGLLRVVIR